MAWGMTVSNNELTANVFLNGHVFKMSLKYCIYILRQILLSALLATEGWTVHRCELNKLQNQLA